MTKMLVTCNGALGTRMDRDYYANTHLQIAMKLWGQYGLEDASAFFPADSGNGVLSVGIYRFRDTAAMKAALASPETALVMADVKNFTDSTVIERSIWEPMDGGWPEPDLLPERERNPACYGRSGKVRCPLL